jgi:hypothetical protein
MLKTRLFKALIVWLLLISCSCVIIFLSVYRGFVDRVYSGALFPGLFTNRAYHPVSYYYAVCRQMFFLLAVAGTLFAAFLIGLYVYKNEVVRIVKRYWVDFLAVSVKVKKRPFIPTKAFFAGALLFLMFCVFYSFIGARLSVTNAFKEPNLLFQLDTPLFISSITGIGPYYHRVFVHPLYVLLLNPITSLLVLLHGQILNAAVTVSAVCGALSVMIAFLIFWTMSRRVLFSSLFCFLFGISAAQIIFSCVPETHCLSGLSLSVLYLVFIETLKHHKIRRMVWLLAGVMTFGATITNFCQAVICFLAAVMSIYDSERASFGRIVSEVIAFIAVTAVCVIVLSLLQTLIFGSKFFISPELAGESGFLSFAVLSKPFAVADSLIRNFIFANVIAAKPVVYLMRSLHFPSVTWGWQYSAVGLLAAASWACLICAGLWRRVLQANKNIYLLIGLGGCFLFSVLLHSFYGVTAAGQIELFTYANSVTLLLFILIFPGLEYGGRFVRFLTVAAIILGAVNNVSVVNAIIDLYR